METKDKKIYSYSRCENYHNCPRSYFYTYIEKNRGEDNIYSFMGSVTHEILEEYFIEEYFEIPVGDKWMKGYIDLYTITDGVIDIYDYKTSSSSSFTGKDAYKKMRQMILYGIAIKQKYPDMPIRSMNFDMLKYYKVPSKRSKLGYTLKDRSTIDILDFTTEFSPAYVSAEFTPEVVEEVTEYVCNTVNEIESLDKDLSCYKKGFDPKKDFFCKTLCSFRDKCLNE